MAVTWGGGSVGWGGGGGGGGTTAPGGADTNLQYNNAGAFDGIATVRYEAIADALVIDAPTTFAPDGGIATSRGIALSLLAVAPAATVGPSQAGVGVSITASPAVASTDTAGAAAGGSVTITAGDAARLSAGSAIGGSINLVPGAGIGPIPGNDAGRVVSTAYHSTAPNAHGTVLLGGSATMSASFLTYGGSSRVGIDATSGKGIHIASGSMLGWTADAALSTTASLTNDTLVRRRAAANPAWGLASATPVAYLHNLAADARSGTDTNVRGGTARIAPGVGTGSGGSGDLIAQTAPKGSSGTTANALVDRVYLYSIAKDLTDGSATGLFEVALPSGSHVGITVEATVNVENASDYQTRRVSMNLSAHNKGGTVTSSTPTEYGASALLDSGTLTTAWTVTNGTGKITVNLNADSDLATQTRLNVRYQVRVDGDLGTLVTPL